MNILLIITIINFALALIALVYVFAITFRVKGVLGNKALPLAFFVFAIANALDVMNNLGIINGGDIINIIRRLSVTLLLFLLAVYFYGFRKLIKRVDGDHQKQSMKNPAAEAKSAKGRKENPKVAYEKEDGYLEMKIKK